MALADEVAAASGLVMAKAPGCRPRSCGASTAGGGARRRRRDLIRSPDEDLFRTSPRRRPVPGPTGPLGVQVLWNDRAPAPGQCASHACACRGRWGGLDARMYCGGGPQCESPRSRARRRVRESEVSVLIVPVARSRRWARRESPMVVRRCNVCRRARRWRWRRRSDGFRLVRHGGVATAAPAEAGTGGRLAGRHAAWTISGRVGLRSTASAGLADRSVGHPSVPKMTRRSNARDRSSRWRGGRPDEGREEGTGARSNVSRSSARWPLASGTGTSDYA